MAGSHVLLRLRTGLNTIMPEAQKVQAMNCRFGTEDHRKFIGSNQASSRPALKTPAQAL